MDTANRSPRPSSRIVSTLAALIVINLLAGAAALRLPAPLTWSSYHMQRQAERVEAVDRCLDRVFTGTSVMGAAADPQLLGGDGQASLNASIGGVGPRVIDDWTSEILLPRTCPKTAVFGFAVRDANDNFVELDAIFDTYIATEGRRRLVGDTGWLDQLDRLLEQHVGVFQLRSAYRRPAHAAAYFLNGSGNWTAVTGDDGHATIYDGRRFEWSPTTEDEIRRESFIDYAHGGVRMQAMASALRSASDPDRIVVLVNLPRPQDPTARLLPGGRSQLEDFDRTMRNLAVTTGVHYLDANDLELPDSAFADTFHLNGEGSTRFSAWLAQRLDELGA